MTPFIRNIFTNETLFIYSINDRLFGKRVNATDKNPKPVSC